MIPGPPPPPQGPVRRQPAGCSQGEGAWTGAVTRHTLQTWAPCMAYKLFGGKEAFEAALARAQQDGVTLGSSS